MAKRRKVIHVKSGDIFNTAAEAERAFGFPNSVLSEAIRLGKPYRGEVFKFYDEADAATPAVDSIEEKDESTSQSIPKKKPDNVSSIKSVLSPLAQGSVKNPPKYDGSPTDKHAASAYFNSIGYDTEVVDGIVYFYDTEFNEVVEAVRDAGYDASWGCSIRANIHREEGNK